MRPKRTSVVIRLGDAQLFVRLKEIDRAARDFVKRSDDGDLAARNRVLHELYFFQILHLQPHVGDDGFAQFGFLISDARNFGNRRNNAVKQCLNVFRFAGAFFGRQQCGFDRAATFVSENDDDVRF